MMHVVLGDGEMTRRELSSTLEDLLEKAGDEDFWFLVQAKAEPTATDKAMMEWIGEKGVYYETIADDHKSADKIYAGSQEKHTVKRLAPKVVSLMQEKPGEGEGAALYALFVNNDEEVEEDRWLFDVATAVADAPEGFVVFAMNDGLAELGFDEEGGGEEEEGGEEPEPEEEPPPAPTKKAAAKKAAAPAKKAAARPAATEPDEEQEEEAGEGEEPEELTREYLEGKTLPELKALAAAREIELPPRTRAQTYIAVLLGEDQEEPPEAETEPVEVQGTDEEEIIMEAEAMVLVIYNGTVVTRTMTVEEARSLAGV
jgi:hypothetical protein